MLRGYWRNLLQSQPNHIEIIGEKNTIASTLRPIAGEYTISLTTGRGYCSLPPRHAIRQSISRQQKGKTAAADRVGLRSGRRRDCTEFRRFHADDFDIEDVHPVRIALTPSRWKKFNLPPFMKASDKSSVPPTQIQCAPW